MSWSLQRRFFAISSAFILSALIVSGVLLGALYEREIKARIDSEIHNHFAQLVGTLEIGDDGSLMKPSLMADPRFRQPRSGLYWQVETEGETLLRSRSLWDSKLQTPGFEHVAIEDPRSFPGPFGEPVLVHARFITHEGDPAQRQLRILVGIDEQEVRASVLKFALLLCVSLSVLAAAMLAVSALQLKVVLAPLRRMQMAIRKVKQGKATRIVGDFPIEIEPVSTKLNSLLVQQEQAIEKARSRAANFAHGLKTPLTIIDALVSEFGPNEASGISRDIGAQTAAIRRLVDRELARSRLVAGHGQPVQDAKSVTDEIINTIRRLPRGQDLQFINDLPSNQMMRLDREDFIELMGNILDNSRKWAKSKILVQLERSEPHDILSISDDGPGVNEQDLGAISQRGKRLDERTVGSGIGLAIVNDICLAYGMDISFARADIGGLQIRMTLPG